jgi:hypothetical protein
VPLHTLLIQSKLKNSLRSHHTCCDRRANHMTHRRCGQIGPRVALGRLQKLYPTCEAQPFVLGPCTRSLAVFSIDWQIAILPWRVGRSYNHMRQSNTSTVVSSGVVKGPPRNWWAITSFNNGFCVCYIEDRRRDYSLMGSRYRNCFCLVPPVISSMSVPGCPRGRVIESSIRTARLAAHVRRIHYDVESQVLQEHDMPADENIRVYNNVL